MQKLRADCHSDGMRVALFDNQMFFYKLIQPGQRRTLFGNAENKMALLLTLGVPNMDSDEVVSEMDSSMGRAP